MKLIFDVYKSRGKRRIAYKSEFCFIFRSNLYKES